MNVLRKLFCLVVVAAASSTVQAFIDPPVVSPEEPTDTTPITLTLRYGECNALLDHEIDRRGTWFGITITKETRSPPGCDVPEAEYEIDLELLPPRRYRYAIYLLDSEQPGEPAEHFTSGSFVVTSAESYLSDIEVELIAEPSTYMPPGTEGRVIARFTNHGPDVTDRVAANTPLGIQFGHQVPYEIYLGPFTTCDVWFSTLSPPPGAPVEATMVYSLHEPLDVGETRECVIGFDSKPTAAGTFTLQVMLFHGTVLNYTDPNPQNNVAELNFVFDDRPAAPVPGLRWPGLLLLVLCLILAPILRGRHV